MVKLIWSWLAARSSWWLKWMGPGTDDDLRNFGWRITEAMIVRVEWAISIFDLRIGYKSGGSWVPIYLRLFGPVTENFWNGIFTLNVYLTKFTVRGVPVVTPRVGLVIRFAHDYYFQCGAGILFDRGEFGWKLRIANAIKEGDQTVGWEEGSV
jgi:hypothetical protein